MWGRFDCDGSEDVVRRLYQEAAVRVANDLDNVDLVQQQNKWLRLQVSDIRSLLTHVGVKVTK